MANAVKAKGYTKILGQGTLTVGVTAVDVPVVPRGGVEAVLIVPAQANTDIIYWGGSGVATTTGAPIGGWPVGDIIPVNPAAGIKLISGTAAQSVRYILLGY